MDNQFNINSSAAALFPPLDRLLPHQREVIFNHHQRFKILVWHRRARKTTTAITELVRQAHRKVGVYWHVFPTYGEAKDAIWRDPAMLFNIIPKELIHHINESELIVFFKNGSLLQLKGADKPERLLGSGPLGVVLDEFAEMKVETWQRVVEPILRANGGWCWFVGTPRGKNHLFEMYQLGQQGKEEWKSWKLKASESGIIAPDQLANARETMRETLFNQEWECEFLEGEGSVFRNVREVMTAEPQKPITGHLYVAGIDLAKVRDYTVISVFDRVDNSQVYQDRLRTLEWPFQKSKIIEISRHYNNSLSVIDATGIGDPIVDDLSRVGLAVEPFKITEPSKKDLIEKLSIWIEQKKIKLLPLQETIFEYDNFSYEIGSTGRIRYGAREGFNDDIIISQALACHALNPISKVIVGQSKTLTRLAYEKAKRQYNQDQAIELAEGGLGEWGAT